MNLQKGNYRRRDPGSNQKGSRGSLAHRVALVSAGLVGAIALFVVLVSVLRVPLNLSWLAEPIETAAKEALGQPFEIEGPITVVAGLPPALRIEQVRIGNPQGWQGPDLLRLRSARARLALLPLLRGEIALAEVAAEGIELNLQRREDGSTNWLPASDGHTQERENEHESGALQFVELRRLRVEDLSMIYLAEGSDEPLLVEVRELTGQAARDRPVLLESSGVVSGIPYELRIEGGTLLNLISSGTEWPVRAQAGVLGLEMAATGSVTDILQRSGISLDFSFEAGSLKDLESILERKLPALQPVDLSGHIEGGMRRYELTELEGRLGANRLRGRLVADFSAGKPDFSGRLDVPVFDAGVFVGAVESGNRDAAAVPSATKPEPEVDPDQVWDIDTPILALDIAKWIDAEFTLSVQEVINAPVSLGNLSLGVSMADGILRSPLAVTFADVPFTGQLSIARQAGDPVVGIDLDARESDIGELAGLFLDASGVRGRFDSVKLRYSARGDTIRSLVGTADLVFSLQEASLSYGHDQPGRPVDFALHHFKAAYIGGEGSTTTAEGALLGEPFSLRLSGGSFKQKFVSGRWPVELEATGGGARLEVRGEVAPLPSGSTLTYRLDGPHIGGLASWIPVSPKSGASYRLTGTFRSLGDDVSIGVTEGRIGDMRFAGEVGIREKGGKPVTVLTLNAGVIDPAQIRVLFPEGGSTTPPGQKQYRAIDVPILPNGIEIFDSDITLSVDRLASTPIAFTDIGTSARIRDGYVGDAPVQLTMDGKVIRGTYGIDLRGEIPVVSLDVRTRQADLGELLQRLGMFEDLELTADQLKLNMTLAGGSAREMMEHSEFTVVLGDGIWRLRDFQTGGQTEIRIDQGTISARRDEPMAFDLSGRLEETPVQMKLRTDSLASFARPKERLWLGVDVRVPNLHLDLKGTAPLPVRRDNLRLDMSLTGRRFSDVNPFLDVSLPPWGPYRMKGTFGTRPTGYYVEDLRVGVGSSILNGNLELQTTARPPFLSVDLEAGSVQLDDFKTGRWSASRDAQDVPATEPGRTESGSTDADRAILSPQVLHMLDGRLDIRVKEVVSGSDHLGDGRLAATLDSGRFSVEDMTLNVPGGRVALAFSIEPLPGSFSLDAKAKVDRFDYGYLARRINPESGAGGRISVDVDFRSRGPSLAHVMDGADGYIDFAIWPRDMNAEIFDLWATNLLIAVLPTLDTEEGSRVNCLVASFGLEDGVMRPDALLIDSTQVQATADGLIDFKSNSFEFVAVPKPKRPQMFSAQTPIRVEGKFSDFDLGVSPGSLLGTTVRIVTSPVVVPLQWVFTEKAPSDGTEACGRAWDNALSDHATPAVQP